MESMILGKSIIFETMNWENISIKQSYELQKASELYEDEFDKKLAVLAAIEGLTFDEALELKISEITKLTAKYGFLEQPIKTKLVTKWNGYNFVIKLSDMKAGQMIDFLETCKEDLSDKIHIILAILDTGDKEFDTKSDDILHNCPITVAKGISDFFFRKYNLSPRIIQDYSLKKLKEMNKILKSQAQTLAETS
jgi:hypothetical protein